MAIFKKLLVQQSEASPTSRKISSAANANTSSFTTTYRQQSQQQQKGPLANAIDETTSPNNGHSINTLAGAGATDAQEQPGVPDDLEDFCWHIYNRTLRRENSRLVIFSEKDSRLLYDSETVVETSDRIIAGSHKSHCGRFQFLPHKYDTLKIAKMLFGTLPTSLKSDSLKIHSLKDSNYIMISRVFSVPRLGKYSSSPFKSRDLYKCMVGSFSSDSDNQSNYSTIHSLEGMMSRGGGGDQFDGNLCPAPGRFPLISSKTFINQDPPEKFVRVRNCSLQLESSAMEDVMEELRAFSPNRLSRARRRQLSQIGLDDGVSIRLSNRSRLSSCSSVADGGCGFSDSSAEWKQYGFAILLPADFRPFIFQHILQIERELDRLVVQIHKAVQDKSQFFQAIYEGWVKICDSICLLCNSLRLKSPIWLSLISSEPERKEAFAAEFCGTLAHLVALLNTKETKFFISTLLSAVLTNQLTWVASVAPPEQCSYDRSMLLGTSVIDPQQMSYNPTVAQLLELYYGSGAVSGEGQCQQFTKVVVVGDKSRLMAQLLSVLSYFIRCSSVESRRKEVLTEEMCEDPLHDFGRSLLAGVCSAYSPHFVLSGIQTSLGCSLEGVLHAIYEDVRHPMGEPCTNSQLMMTLSPSSSQALATSTELKNQQQQQLSPNSNGGDHNNLAQQLATTRQQQRAMKVSPGPAGNGKISSPEKLAKQPPLIQEEMRNSLVVLIDMFSCEVRVISALNCQIEEVPFVCPSDAVSSMLEEFAELYSYKCASDFLLSFLEDRLGSLLAKSNVLVNLVNTTDMKEPLPMERVSSILDCDCSDLRLILNVASVYSPGILATAL